MRALARKRPPRLLPNIAEVIDRALTLRPSPSAWRAHRRDRGKVIAAQFRDESPPWDFADAVDELRHLFTRGNGSGSEEAAKHPAKNCAQFSGTKTPASPTSGDPLGAEVACDSCGEIIVKTRRARRFCSKLCNDTFHGRRRAKARR